MYHLKGNIANLRIKMIDQKVTHVFYPNQMFNAKHMVGYIRAVIDK